MAETSIYEYNDSIKVFYTNRKAILPEEYAYEVGKHWDSLMRDGKEFFRGDCLP